MIRLDEVAKKIENILNGTDEDVINLNLSAPTAFFFKVATEGFHLDGVFDIPEGKNFIPVFISSMGGQFNPVPELLQANYVIPIVIYFPIRFKDDMYKLNEYLAKVFVGRNLNYGKYSGSALSNISVAQFGEIQDMDLNSYAEWQTTVYKKPVEVMEPYISMQLSLYLSTVADDFVYGNNATATLQINSSSVEFGPENLTFVQASIQSNTEPSIQQLLGSSETEGLPSGTSYGASFSVYIKNNDFFKYLIEQWFLGNAQTLPLTLNVSFLDKTFTRTVYVHSVNFVFQKGELATMTFTFSRKLVI